MNLTRAAILSLALALVTGSSAYAADPPVDFVEPGVDPSVYVDRYLHDEQFAEWYGTYYPETPFYEALMLSEAEYEDIVMSLMQTVCGPGTTLVGSECVAEDEAMDSGEVMSEGYTPTLEMGVAAVGAFAAAFAVILILWLPRTLRNRRRRRSADA